MIIIVVERMNLSGAILCNTGCELNDTWFNVSYG